MARDLLEKMVTTQQRENALAAAKIRFPGRFRPDPHFLERYARRFGSIRRAASIQLTRFRLAATGDSRFSTTLQFFHAME